MSNPRSWSPSGGGYSIGNRIRTWFRHERSPVTWILLGILILVFIAEFAVPGFYEAFAFSPGFLSIGYGYFEPWRMVTSVLLHSMSFLPHILFNGYALWAFGRQLEPMIGPWRYVGLFVVSGIGGSTMVALLSPQSIVIGASGAVFGLMGAFFVILRSLGYQSTQLIVLIVINLAIGFFPGSGVSWQAHLGGLLVGGLIGWVYSTHRYGRARHRRSGWIVVGIGIALVIVAIVRVNLLLL